MRTRIILDSSTIINSINSHNVHTLVLAALFSSILLTLSSVSLSVSIGQRYVSRIVDTRKLVDGVSDKAHCNSPSIVCIYYPSCISILQASFRSSSHSSSRSSWWSSLKWARCRQWPESHTTPHPSISNTSAINRVSPLFKRHLVHHGSSRYCWWLLRWSRCPGYYQGRIPFYTGGDGTTTRSLTIVAFWTILNSLCSQFQYSNVEEVQWNPTVLFLMPECVLLLFLLCPRDSPSRTRARTRANVTGKWVNCEVMIVCVTDEDKRAIFPFLFSSFSSPLVDLQQCLMWVLIPTMPE